MGTTGVRCGRQGRRVWETRKQSDLCSLSSPLSPPSGLSVHLPHSPPLPLSSHSAPTAACRL
ncbi:MAG: hypothetical protein ACHBN1_11970 [Heteroscytonema crispum UTEX LB 1556]